jgi:hypothetical protein
MSWRSMGGFHPAQGLFAWQPYNYVTLLRSQRRISGSLSQSKQCCWYWFRAGILLGPTNIFSHLFDEMFEV